MFLDVIALVPGCSSSQVSSLRDVIVSSCLYSLIVIPFLIVLFTDEFSYMAPFLVYFAPRNIEFVNSYIAPQTVTANYKIIRQVNTKTFFL